MNQSDIVTNARNFKPYVRSNEVEIDEEHIEALLKMAFEPSPCVDTDNRTVHEVEIEENLDNYNYKRTKRKRDESKGRKLYKCRSCGNSKKDHICVKPVMVIKYSQTTDQQ